MMRWLEIILAAALLYFVLVPADRVVSRIAYPPILSDK